MLPVTRAPKGEGVTFARILNETLQNPQLSFRARGLLAYVLSKPETWRHSADSLAAASSEGKSAILTALRELEAHGHSKLEKVRGPDGTIRNCRIFTETPTHSKQAEGEPISPIQEMNHRPLENRPSVNRPVGKGGVLETTVNKPQNEMREMCPARVRGRDSFKDKARLGTPANPRPLPSEAEVIAYGSQHGYANEEVSAFLTYQKKKNWERHRKPLRDWQKAMEAWIIADRNRKTKLATDSRPLKEILDAIEAEGYEREEGRIFMERLTKAGQQLPNPLNGRMEPVKDIVAAFGGWRESDLVNEMIEKLHWVEDEEEDAPVRPASVHTTGTEGS